MSTKSLIFLLLIITIGLPQTYVAVIDLEGKGLSNNQASIVTDRLRSELFRTNTFTVIERDLITEILNEQGLQVSGCTSKECIVEIGKLIGVKKIVGGSVSRIGNLFSLNVRLINVETGQIDKISTYDYNGSIEDFLIIGTKYVAYDLAGLNTSRILNQVIPNNTTDNVQNKATSNKMQLTQQQRYVAYCVGISLIVFASNLMQWPSFLY